MRKTAQILDSRYLGKQYLYHIRNEKIGLQRPWTAAEAQEKGQSGLYSFKRSVGQEAISESSIKDRLFN